MGEFVHREILAYVFLILIVSIIANVFSHHVLTYRDSDADILVATQVGNPKPIYLFDTTGCEPEDDKAIESTLAQLSQDTGVRFFRIYYPLALVFGGISYECNIKSYVGFFSHETLGEAEGGWGMVSYLVFAWNKITLYSNSKKVVLHETLHSMGVWHRNDPDSIMHPYINYQAGFDSDLKEVISKIYTQPLAYLNLIPLNLAYIVIIAILWGVPTKD